ncbi:hypothetical protein BC939DRAFT_462669 [Gamsiella multidivaricata]|uniref:uncharacterized protein n=1 Tax=Gamsiella multidivaricata TaxID=101098 RepID=UPI0022201A96|nr:uncharacterized protein BC939DRAFT_462669 [Gamsiella multidivaricata]KAI7818497.1 hypothetical protein BC939DRAFT_462669 [Gamsiella multidivaricata]
MAASIRSVAMGLPRVSMARIPLVAFANTHVAPLSHANSVHPSAFSSMPASRKDKTWSNSANKVADQLEHTASKFPEDNDRTTKDYLREVKQFEHAEDALLRDLGLIKSVHQEDDIYNHSKHPSKNTPSKNTPSKSTASKSNSSTGKKRAAKSAEEPKDTFEETFVAQVRADVFYPSTKMNHDDSQHHQQEMVSSLLEELKVPCLFMFRKRWLYLYASYYRICSIRCLDRMLGKGTNRQATTGPPKPAQSTGEIKRTTSSRSDKSTFILDSLSPYPFLSFFFPPRTKRETTSS